MAMAGRQRHEPGEGMSAREAQGMSFGGGLDHFLRRLDNANDAAEPVGASLQQQQQASPSSNSVAALVSNYDALSPNPVNPWQYLSLSNPASPTSQQREYYNHLSAHTSSGGYLQRDLLATEWNMLDELEQQRAVSQAQTSQAPAMDHQLHSQPPAPVSRRGAENCVEHSEAAANFIYGEAAVAAAAWYRNGGYMRGPDAALYESLARLDTQTSDSTQLDGEARVRSWERAMTSQYFGAGESTVQDPPWPSRAPPASPEAAPAEGSTRSANSVRTPSNTSQSSGSDGDDSDEEECTRVGSASGDGNMSSGKRLKTPELSGEDRNDSARTSSEAEVLKKTAASLLRRRSSFKKPREPRYAIKTRTDVDIMDDGFKWRKYGQKAVKNSPHPRNYYRCTTPQCPVRKRVERSHEDSGLVITTYEGTHMHQAPGFRGPVAQYGEGSPRPALARFPFPPEFSFAALQQLRVLHQVARLAQISPKPPFPAPSTAQRESIRRAQQFLGLHDPTFGAVKQEPTFFDFMAQLRGTPNPLFPSRNFQAPSRAASFLDRMRQHQMRGPSPPMPDLDYPDLPPPPTTDTDLVRRVLEAEDHGPNTDANADLNVDSSSADQTFASQIQSSLRSRVELERRMSLQQSDPGLMRRRHSSNNLRSTSSQQRAWQLQHHGSDDDSLVDGSLMQEMAQPTASRKSID